MIYRFLTITINQVIPLYLNLPIIRKFRGFADCKLQLNSVVLKRIVSNSTKL